MKTREVAMGGEQSETLEGDEERSNEEGGGGPLLFLRKFYWQPVSYLAFNHCAQSPGIFPLLEKNIPSPLLRVVLLLIHIAQPYGMVGQ